MNSRLYECHVMHARFLPKPHRFVYRIFMIAVDLDELPALDRRLHLFSLNRPNLYSFREPDFLPTAEPLHNASVDSDRPAPAPKPATLKTRVLAYLAERGVDLGTGGRIELVTLPRVLGYLFNPVSFYFCYDHSGACVASIAEVTNTFREMKPYFLGPAAADDSGFKLRTPKNFYVSPYSDVDVDFDFHLRAPAGKLAIQIDDYVDGKRTLTSTLTGPARPLTDAALAWFTFKYPFITLQVIAFIHWHALRLYLKKIPWFSKAARPADQRDLYRPHASISHANPLSHDA
ncbi:MAG TPA: DUF1365 domain-containing protein [Rariglobus sp.]|nr:DUF1365 domain-containing protein [Rariglobus sp.]